MQDQDRNRCTDQDADSRQMTEQMNRTRYRCTVPDHRITGMQMH